MPGNTVNVPTVEDKSFNDQMNLLNETLIRIADGQGGYAGLSWDAWKRTVDAGLVASVSPVGSQLSDEWYKDANTHYSAPWDVAHIFSNGDVAIKQHFAIPEGVPFDEPEAIYYADGTETAGTYHIGIGFNYGDGWKTTKTIQITTNVDMAEGDQLVINCGTNSANDPTNGRTWNLYAKGSTTSKDTGTTSDGTGGTSLGSTSSSGAGYTNGRVNAPQRIVYGYGRYSQSAIRQYLNSRAAVGAWWSAQNAWDRPPAVAATLRGWATGMTQDLYDLLEPVPVVTAINTVEGSADTTETTNDKVFLPSLQEMYINPQLANVEGEDWDYFKELASEAGLTGKFAQYGTYPILISYRVDSTTSPVPVWLRSAYRGYAHVAWFVGSGGSVGNDSAYHAIRGCPACIIKKSA